MKSKTIDILKTFSPQEIKSFRDFINSPFHNKNKNVIKLFGELKKHYPGFSTNRLTKENIFKKIYPSKRYNDLVMRILLSDLLKLLEKFLVQLGLEKTKIDCKRYLVGEFTERKLFNFLKKELNYVSEADITHPDDLIHKMFIANQKTNFNILTGNQKGNDVNLTDFGKYLITYFLIKIPAIHYDLNIHKDLYNAAPDYNFIDKFIDDFDISGYIQYLEKNDFEYKNLIKLYYYLYMSRKEIKNDEYYFEFKNLLKKIINKFDEREQYNIYIKLESLAIEKIEVGKKEFYNELFEIYSRMIKGNILSESKSKFIPIELFRNIVFTGTVLKKYNWTENFINKYITKISPELRNNVYNHSYAHIYFQTKDFVRSIEYLNKVKYDLFVYKADVKILAMRIYYEMSDYEPAYSLIDSFKKFVANNKNISGLFRKRYDSFIKHYQSLLRTKSDSSNGNLNDIEYDLEKDDLVYNKKWFLEKVEELKSGK